MSLEFQYQVTFCNCLFPPSYVVHYTSKLQCQLFHFNLETSWDKRNLNYEIYNLTTLGTSWAGPNFQKFSLLPQMWKKPNYMVMMSGSSLSIKFMAPGPRVQALGLGQYYHIIGIFKWKMTTKKCQLSPKSIKRNTKSKQSNTDL